jgi:hypothetical protein
MSLESRIYAALSGATALTALVGSNIYPEHRPQEDTAPAVVYGRVSGLRLYHLQGFSGLENPRVQIDSYATSVDGRREVAAQVVAAMEASTTFKAMALISPMDDYDDRLKIYRRIFDFSIWNHD